MNWARFFMPIRLRKISIWCYHAPRVSMFRRCITFGVGKSSEGKECNALFGGEEDSQFEIRPIFRNNIKINMTQLLEVSSNASIHLCFPGPLGNTFLASSWGQLSVRIHRPYGRIEMALKHFYLSVGLTRSLVCLALS